MSTDVQFRVARILDYDLATVASDGETLQLLRVSLPDGTYSPWLAFEPKQYSDLIHDMGTRQHAALERDFG